MNTLIEQMSDQLDVLNALIEEMRWRNGRIAKAVASAKAAERGEESARRDAGMVSDDPHSAAHPHRDRRVA